MKVSIRTAYRIVKKTEDPESDPIFIPQYQEEGSEDWHNFTVHIQGRGHGYNTIYFYIPAKARLFIEDQKALQDVLIYCEDESGKWSESSSEDI
jgi:hypothetical protein